PRSRDAAVDLATRQGRAARGGGRGRGATESVPCKPAMEPNPLKPNPVTRPRGRPGTAIRLLAAMTLMQPPAAQPQAQQSSDRPGLAYGTGLWDWPMGLACGTGLWDWPVGLEIDHRGRAAPCAAGLAFSGLTTAAQR